MEAGTAKLIGTDSANILNEVSVLLDSTEAYKKMSQAPNPFRDGNAAKKSSIQLKKLLAH